MVWYAHVCVCLDTFKLCIVNVSIVLSRVQLMIIQILRFSSLAGYFNWDYLWLRSSMSDRAHRLCSLRRQGQLPAGHVHEYAYQSVPPPHFQIAEVNRVFSETYSRSSTWIGATMLNLPCFAKRLVTSCRPHTLYGQHQLRIKAQK